MYYLIDEEEYNNKKFVNLLKCMVVIEYKENKDSNHIYTLDDENEINKIYIEKLEGVLTGKEVIVNGKEFYISAL